MLAAAAALAALACSPQLAAATEINSAVSIFGPWDYELRDDGGSRCTDMVKRTAELGVNSRTMFLPTLFWVSKHPEGFFETNPVRWPPSIHRPSPGAAPAATKPCGRSMCPECWQHTPVVPRLSWRVSAARRPGTGAVGPCRHLALRSLLCPSILSWAEWQLLMHHIAGQEATTVLKGPGQQEPRILLQVDAEQYFDDQREVEYFCFNQQYHRAPKQVCGRSDSDTHSAPECTRTDHAGRSTQRPHLNPRHAHATLMWQARLVATTPHATAPQQRQF